MRHLVARGESLEVCTDYPGLYRFPGAVRFAPWSRQVHYTAHYTERKHDLSTHQFQDMCQRCGIREPVDLTLDWDTHNPALVERVRRAADGRPILFVHGGREAFGRSDGFGLELLPKAEVFNAVLTRLRRKFFAVYVGRGKRLFEVAVDLDLNGQTSVTDTIDLGLAADAFYAQCSFVIPLAESFAKPLLVMFSAKGLVSRKPAVRTITPRKVLSKATSLHVIDNLEHARIDEVADKFCDVRAGQGAVPGQAGGGGRQRADMLAESG